MGANSEIRVAVLGIDGEKYFQYIEALLAQGCHAAPVVTALTVQNTVNVRDSREAAILSTCNRSELYVEQDRLNADAVLQWLADYHNLSLEELRACAYIHEDDAAVRHMMRVASGLDSLVLGEPQILGQMKSAYAVAREAGTVGPLLGRLFQATFNSASAATSA